MAKLIFKDATIEEIAAMDLASRPFLHEQGQIVLRGFVQSFKVSQEEWCMTVHKIEVLQKYAGVWSREEQTETYHGPIKQTSFSCYSVKDRPKLPINVNFSCYGSQFHIGMPADDPWRGNIWPELDTDYLTPDMTSSTLR